MFYPIPQQNINLKKIRKMNKSENRPSSAYKPVNDYPHQIIKKHGGEANSKIIFQFHRQKH